MCQPLARVLAWGVCVQVRLLKEGEDLQAMLKLPPEEVLLRWVNYHMAKGVSAAPGCHMREVEGGGGASGT